VNSEQTVTSMSTFSDILTFSDGSEDEEWGDVDAII